MESESLKVLLLFLVEKCEELSKEAFAQDIGFGDTSKEDWEELMQPLAGVKLKVYDLIAAEKNHHQVHSFDHQRIL
jgi:hypothetical protein